MRSLALASLLWAGCKSPAPSSTTTRIATVNGEQVRAVVPPQLRGDSAAYQSFARQFVYRAAIAQKARAEGVTLTAAERAAVDANLPSLPSVKEWLRAQSLSWDDYKKDAYAVALVQKLEQRDVFARVNIGVEELKAAYNADASGPRGPRRFVAAVAILGGCDQAEAGKKLAKAMWEMVLPWDGHRIDVAKVAAAAGLDGARLWALDLHLDAAGKPVTLASYDRARDAAGPMVGPPLTDALAAWVQKAGPLDVFTPRCIDGALWVAREVGQAGDRRLRFDEAADELEAPLLFARQKDAFNAYVDGTLQRTQATIVPLGGRP
jgi:hypothetical protein